MSTSLAVAFGNMIVLTNEDQGLRDAALDAWASSICNIVTLSSDICLYLFADESSMSQNKHTMELTSFNTFDDLVEWLLEQPALVESILSHVKSRKSQP